MYVARRGGGYIVVPAYNDIQAESLRGKTERSQCDFMIDKNQGWEKIL